MVKKKLLTLTNTILERIGLKLQRVSCSFEKRTASAFLACSAGSLMDCGAHLGDFSAEAIRLGFAGPVVLIEPIPELCETLRLRFGKVANAHIVTGAVSNRSGNEIFHCAEIKATSSLATPSKVLTDNLQGASPKNSVNVRVYTLDELSATLPPPIFLKIDVQGAEMDVLSGMTRGLSKVRFILLELSFVKLYEGSRDFGYVVNWMYEHGFKAVDINRGYWLPVQKTLGQVDVLFEAFRDC